MKKYISYISWLAMNKTNQIFKNCDEAHALEVFKKIFAESEKTIRILAGCLTSKVPNDSEYLAALSSFIEEKKGRLIILLNNYNSNHIRNSLLIQRLAYFKARGAFIYVKSTDIKVHRVSDEEKRSIHFTVGDEKSYRMETDTIEKSAECNFNDPDRAQYLISIFDEIYNDPKSEEVDLIGLFRTNTEENDSK